MLPKEIEKHRFTVEEYHLMGEAGVFTEDDRVELIEGEILEMTPLGWRHAQVVNTLNSLLVLRLGGEYEVSPQNPLVLGDRSEPMPDLAVLHRQRPGGRLPFAGEAALVVEVSDSSLTYDREIKLPLYAAAGALEAWVVDLRADRIEVYSTPGASTGGYAKMEAFGRGETLQSATIDGLSLPVDEILGTATEST